MANVFFDNIEQLRSSTTLQAGDVAFTKGFYSVNDGGGSIYNIINTSDIVKRRHSIVQESIKMSGSLPVFSAALVDDVTLILLPGDTLYADMIIDPENYVSIRQLGGRSLEDGVFYDNAVAAENFKTLVRRKRDMRTLYIPSGHWCFSPVNMHVVESGSEYQGLGIKIKGCVNHTYLMPYNLEQEVIFNFGLELSNSNYYSTTIQDRGCLCKDVIFAAGKAALNGKSDLESLYGDSKYLSIAALEFGSIPYSTLDNVKFEHIYNVALRLGECYESHFEGLEFYCCGGINKSRLHPVILVGPMQAASSQSALWFPYMKFKSCMGPLIYGASSDFCHCEFGTIIIDGDSEDYNTYSNETNISGTSDPGYNTDISTKSIVNFGAIDGYSGFTSSWPNIFQQIQVSNFDCWASRYSYDINNELVKDSNNRPVVVYYKMVGIVNRNPYDLYKITVDPTIKVSGDFSKWDSSWDSDPTAVDDVYAKFFIPNTAFDYRKLPQVNGIKFALKVSGLTSAVDPNIKVYIKIHSNTTNPIYFSRTITSATDMIPDTDTTHNFKNESSIYNILRCSFNHYNDKTHGYYQRVKSDKMIEVGICINDLKAAGVDTDDVKLSVLGSTYGVYGYDMKIGTLYTSGYLPAFRLIFGSINPVFFKGTGPWMLLNQSALGANYIFNCKVPDTSVYKMVVSANSFYRKNQI